MEAGHYVVRVPARATRDRLHVETRPFRIDPADLADIAPEPGTGTLADYARRRSYHQAEIWAHGLRKANTRDDIFVIEVGADAEAPAIPPSRLLADDGRPTMAPGFYAVRLPSRGSGTRLTVESVCFAIRPDIDGVEARERALMSATNWADFVAGQHPRDTVFVIERGEEKADRAKA